MHTTPQNTLGFALIGLALSSVAASTHGAAIYQNSTIPTVGSTLSTVGNARYLLSHTNYDQNLQAGGGSVTTTNIAQRELGNVSVLTGRDFTFTLENRAGQGLLFTLSSPATGNLAAINSTIAWGTFSPAVPGSVSTIGGLTVGGPFNSISIAAQASRASTSLEFTNFVFTSPDITVADGMLYSGIASTSASNAATGSLYSPGPTVAPFNFLSQQIIGDTDLSQYNFTLSGTVKGIRDLSGSGASAVAFQVGLSNREVTFPSGGQPIVPEPTGLVALMPATALLARRRR